LISFAEFCKHFPEPSGTRVAGWVFLWGAGQSLPGRQISWLGETLPAYPGSRVAPGGLPGRERRLSLCEGDRVALVREVALAADEVPVIVALDCVPDRRRSGSNALDVEPVDRGDGGPEEPRAHAILRRPEMGDHAHVFGPETIVVSNPARFAAATASSRLEKEPRWVPKFVRIAEKIFKRGSLEEATVRQRQGTLCT
jgi:hypothetical protein